jgi:hypothetical protein
MDEMPLHASIVQQRQFWKGYSMSTCIIFYVRVSFLVTDSIRWCRHNIVGLRCNEFQTWWQLTFTAVQQELARNESDAKHLFIDRNKNCNLWYIQASFSDNLQKTGLVCCAINFWDQCYSTNVQLKAGVSSIHTDWKIIISLIYNCYTIPRLGFFRWHMDNLKPVIHNS